MKKHGLSLLISVIALALAAAALFFSFSNKNFSNSAAAIILLESPTPNQAITSPLTISGRARGTWFFEATFPVVLTDWDGRIIAEHYATARDEWMTEAFVPFTAALEFENPAFPDADVNHFSRRGSLILQKANPSGLSEYDDALEIPVWFRE